MNPKIIFFTICACIAVGGCTSRYCDPGKPVQATREIFVTQFQEGIHNSGENLQRLGRFVRDDFANAGSRLVDTTKTIYDGVSFKRGFTDMKSFASVIGDQVAQGCRDTPANLRLIAKCFCLCGD